MKRLSEGYYPSLITAIIIMVIMGMPGNYFPTVVTLWDWLSPDKIIHLILFAAFSFITSWGFRNTLLHSDKSRNIRFLLATFIITTTYGGLTEILQKHLFIKRYGCFYDFIADTLGCLIGIFIFVFYMKKKLKKINNTKTNI